MTAYVAAPLLALAIFVAAAIGEIAGSFAFWSVFRLSKSVWWLLPGTASLIAFAWILTRTDAAFAGRAFAAYGGVFIVSSLAWLWLIERLPPDRWDTLGGAVSLAGAAIILLAPR